MNVAGSSWRRVGRDFFEIDAESACEGFLEGFLLNFGPYAGLSLVLCWTLFGPITRFCCLSLKNELENSNQVLL